MKKEEKRCLSCGQDLLSWAAANQHRKNGCPAAQQQKDARQLEIAKREVTPTSSVSACLLEEGGDVALFGESYYDVARNGGCRACLPKRLAAVKLFLQQRSQKIHALLQRPHHYLLNVYLLRCFFQVHSARIVAEREGLFCTILTTEQPEQFYSFVAEHADLLGAMLKHQACCLLCRCSGEGDFKTAHCKSGPQVASQLYGLQGMAQQLSLVVRDASTSERVRNEALEWTEIVKRHAAAKERGIDPIVVLSPRRCIGFSPLVAAPEDACDCTVELMNLLEEVPMHIQRHFPASEGTVFLSINFGTFVKNVNHFHLRIAQRPGFEYTQHTEDVGYGVVSVLPSITDALHYVPSVAKAALDSVWRDRKTQKSCREADIGFRVVIDCTHRTLWIATWLELLGPSEALLSLCGGGEVTMLEHFNTRDALPPI